MKKLLLITILSLLGIVAFSQRYVTYNGAVVVNNVERVHNIAPAGGGGDYTEEYQAVYDQLTSKPTEAIAGYQDDMVTSLVSAGIWAKLDLFYVFAQSSESDAYINWIDPSGGDFDCTEVGAGNLTFTQYQGIDGDGTNYLNTSFNINTDGTNFVQNSASIGVYSRQDVEEDAYAIGAYDDASTGREIYIRTHITTSDRVSMGVNTVVSPVVYGRNNGAGFFIGSRRASDDVEIYANGATLENSTNGSTAGYSADIYILGCNIASGGSGQSTAELSLAFLGAGLDDTEVSNFNTIVETYMDALSIGVQ